ncbi:hypothetical protein Nepgr_014796 [Nepenthes gracilis]|uniref:Uncharacterized protein n=1 Tax=Nepenthes gracilis TaxID=150966 RepID=A0AAD3SLK2_NEPGR|nr:hypothetical protein Nepgr_014796 [Nepenthes gracilis]
MLADGCIRVMHVVKWISSSQGDSEKLLPCYLRFPHAGMLLPAIWNNYPGCVERRWLEEVLGMTAFEKQQSAVILLLGRFVELRNLFWPYSTYPNFGRRNVCRVTEWHPGCQFGPGGCRTCDISWCRYCRYARWVALLGEVAYKPLLCSGWPVFWLCLLLGLVIYYLERFWNVAPLDGVLEAARMQLPDEW